MLPWGYKHPETLALSRLDARGYGLLSIVSTSYRDDAGILKKGNSRSSAHDAQVVAAMQLRTGTV